LRVESWKPLIANRNRLRIHRWLGLLNTSGAKAPPGYEPNAAAEEDAEKLKFLSFRGTLRAEESLILLTLKTREIPRFARNDKINYSFRSL
jgi:hypothetical protein